MIPIAKPLLGEAEAQAASRAVLSGWVTQGPAVAAFEAEFAEAVGARHACAVSSCTAALHLALLAVGVAPGDEVVTVSHSYIATANAVRYCGASPVFVDIDPLTYNLEPGALRQAITERTKAVLCVHQMGMPCDLERVLAIAREHELPVVEDAACAIGSEIRLAGRWERIGKPHGDIACFSFHPRKILTTGDGGMITTANALWDEHFRLWRQHAMSIPDTVRHTARDVVFETYPTLGFNYRMTDIQAAIGREQLSRLPRLLAERRALAERYRMLLADVPGLSPPCEPDWAVTNWQSYCVRLPEGVDQRNAMQVMLEAGVATRRGIMCAHREPAYAGVELRFPLPQSERAQDQCLLLPLYPQMTEDEQVEVVSALKMVCHPNRIELGHAGQRR
jgi:dTDP-4-amino-4,6-dideoxygalactose transaminase